MGKLNKLIIRIGATGNTARWVAKHYLRLKNSETTNSEVFRKIVDFRYQTFNLNQSRDKLLKRLSYLDNLTDLTFSILQLEGAIKTKDAPMNLQMEIMAVIMEELKKKNIPEGVIIGTNKI